MEKMPHVLQDIAGILAKIYESKAKNSVHLIKCVTRPWKKACRTLTQLVVITRENGQVRTEH